MEPIIVNTFPGREKVVIGGHQRLKVLQELGTKKVSCVEVCLDPKKEKELNVRLNQNGGEFDFDLLQEHFTRADLAEFGFSLDELDEAFGEEINPERLGTDFELRSGDKQPFEQIAFILHDVQAELVRDAIKSSKMQGPFEDSLNENSNGNALYRICQFYIEHHPITNEEIEEEEEHGES